MSRSDGEFITFESVAGEKSGDTIFMDSTTATCNVQAVRACVATTVAQFRARHPSVEYVCQQDDYLGITSCSTVTEVAERECIRDACQILVLR